ncbi:MAG: glycosyltransferase family 61 protein [Candidatus Paracaedibacteraceae bacterium]|nr:glycosyltransferase family 61 protein [Candidatus Paracaedibacteraceae bacterium]
MKIELKSLESSLNHAACKIILETKGMFSFEKFVKNYLNVKFEENNHDELTVFPPIFLQEYQLFSHKNVIIDRYGILYDEQNIPIPDALNTYEDIDNYVSDCGMKDFSNVEEIHFEKPPVLFFDHYFYNFGHFLTEAYPRLFLVKDLLKKGHKILLPPKLSNEDKRYDYYQHIQPCLDALGITDKDIIQIPKQGVKLSSLIMPSHVKFREDYVIPAINHLKDYFYEPSFEWKSDKLYISRRDTSLRKITNEEKVEFLLRNYFGFKVIAMSDYSFKEKINIMMRVNTLVSVDSSSLINCIFMNENAQILGLRPKEFGFFNIALTSLFNQKLFLQICKFGTLDTHHFSGHLFVDLAKLFENLLAITNQPKTCKTRIAYLFIKYYSLLTDQLNELNKWRLQKTEDSPFMQKYLRVKRNLNLSGLKKLAKILLKTRN